MLRERFRVSERRACKVAGQHRSTQGLEPPCHLMTRQSCAAGSGTSPSAVLGGAWRCASKGLRRQGWSVVDKRVRGLRRDEGLQVPAKTKKKRLTGLGAHVGAMSLIARHALWVRRRGWSFVDTDSFVPWRGPECLWTLRDHFPQALNG